MIEQALIGAAVVLIAITVTLAIAVAVHTILKSKKQ
jgi:hypothetical protein